MLIDDTSDYRVRISDEGLRRSANDNALLARTAKTRELIAATACGGIVVAFVLMFVHSLAGG
jgi:hypothetical protein